jgi:hypothetical protein
MIRAALTIAVVFLCIPATAPEVIFISPCECQGFHGKTRWVTKTDQAPVIILGFIAAGIWLWQSADRVFWHAVVSCVIVWILADVLTWGFAVALQFIVNVTMDCMVADVLREDYAQRSWNAINDGSGFEREKRAEFAEAVKQLYQWKQTAYTGKLPNSTSAK